MSEKDLENEGGESTAAERKSGVQRKVSGSSTPPSPRVVVPLPEKREVNAAHSAQLSASGLTPETVALAALYSEYRPARLAELVQRRTWSRMQGGALVLPFYLPDATEPYAYRVRPDTPRVEKKKNGKDRPVKYDQASAYKSLVYYPPRARSEGRLQADSTLYWTEGEKKALLLDQLGYACVGLTGVWLWHDVEHKDSTGETRLHPQITKYVRVAGRSHVICFDADSKHKDNIMKAAQRLAGVLRAAGATEVRFVCPPDLAAKGIDDYYAAHGEDATRALLLTAAELEAIAPDAPLPKLRSLKALRDAPLDESLRMPEGYELQRDGSLWVEGTGKNARNVLVTRAPLFLGRKLVDHYSGEERAELIYQRSDAYWTQISASRKALADARTMVFELAPYGVPVNSSSAGKLVEWLDAFDHANPQLQRVACVPNTGWHRAESTTFFATHSALTPEDVTLNVAVDSRGDRKRVFDSLKPRGELATHLAALGSAWAAEPTCAMVICAAFAATLLEPLRSPNFAVHLAGDSSRGKTSQLKIAASVFGDPANPQWLASWSTTSAGAEQRASILCDLPQCYDEVGGTDAEETERMLYALINGRGRTRASKDMQLRESSTWRTVVLSTGERELAGEETATGAKVRVLQLSVQGFGELTAPEIDALVDACTVNAGSAGEAWLKRVVAYDEWPKARAALAEQTKRMRTNARDPLQGRVAAYYALLALTERLTAEFLGLGDRKGETMQRLFSDLAAGHGHVQSVGERARELIDDWVMSDPDAFPELERGGDGEFDARSRGKVRHGFRREGLLYLIPDEFRSFCVRHRLWALEVIRQWARAGWTLHDTGRLDKHVRIGGRLSRFYVLYPHDKATLSHSQTELDL